MQVTLHHAEQGRLDVEKPSLEITVVTKTCKTFVVHDTVGVSWEHGVEVMTDRRGYVRDMGKTQENGELGFI